MKISIANFKSIKELNNFEIKPLTVLSGVNSSGKSSFIQLLLLLKQTVDLNSANILLQVDGDLYKVADLQDVLYNKDINNNLKISFQFDKAEFARIKNRKITNLFDIYGDYQCLIEIEYASFEDQTYIREFLIKIELPEGDKREQYVEFLIDKNAAPSYRINTNTGVFGNELFFDKPDITDIGFSSIFPSFYEISRINKLSNELEELVFEKKIPSIDEFKNLVNNFFHNILYLGPLREQPKDDYFPARNLNGVGTKGEFTAQILEIHAGDPIDFFKIELKDDGVDYQKIDSTLLEGVKYWMCEAFDIAEDIYAKKINDNFRIILVNNSGLSTTIKHVGFGISQILPIIVQGLKMPNGGTLILEQPEIHLHPKYQSLLFDFLYGLTLQGKTIIIETHSDHLITRMRRRIAEDATGELRKNINLTFIEADKQDSLFRTLDFDDYGVLDYFPKDFVEQNDLELKAVVKAQMKKRIKK